MAGSPISRCRRDLEEDVLCAEVRCRGLANLPGRRNDGLETRRHIGRCREVERKQHDIAIHRRRKCDATDAVVARRELGNDRPALGADQLVVDHEPRGGAETAVADEPKAAAVKPEQNVVLGKSRHGETPLGWRGSTCPGARNQGGHRYDAAGGSTITSFSENCRAAGAGLLVVSILTANAGADQTNGAERVELYGVLKIRIFVDGLTNLCGGRRRDRLEIVWISHIGS